MVTTLSVLQHVLKPESAQKIALGLAKATAPASKIAHRYGPEILVGTGIAGGVTAAVLGARATLKVESVLDKMHDDIATAEGAAELVTTDNEPVYDAKTIKRTITAVKIRGALQIAKLYVPAATIGLASIACVLGAHGIMKRREVGLIAAYNALEKGFAAYRKRVSEEYGEQKDFDILHNVTEEKVKNEETGKNEVQAKTNGLSLSPYARVFDDNNRNWEKRLESNIFFLNAQQNYFNDRLKIKGHVFLNEIYDALGFEHTQSGQVVGWVVNGQGDDYIDFGIYDIENDRKRLWVNGQEKGIWLDFNIDGEILDKI
jgi:hypothetical protein